MRKLSTTISIVLSFLGILGVPILLSAMVFPGSSWQTATPGSQNVDAAILDEAMTYMDNNFEETGAKRAVIIRNGYLIWDGVDSNVIQPLTSCTKTVTSTVLGLLYDDGLIDIEDYAKQYSWDMNDIYPDVKIKHLASMTAGYVGQALPPGNICEVLPKNKCLYDLVPGPKRFEPGAKWQYLNPSVAKLAAILIGVKGSTLESIFSDRVASKIGMSNWTWISAGEAQCEVDGITFHEPTGYCGNGVHTTALDFARYGHLYLNKGKWGETRVLSESFVTKATTVQVPASTPCPRYYCYAGQYGYYWYVNASDKIMWPNAPAGTYFARGGSRNFCIVIPSWDMVIIRMAPNTEVIDLDNKWNNFFGILKNGVYNIMLPPPPPPTDNIISNASFEIDNNGDNKPDDWVISKNTALDATHSIDGNYSAKVKNSSAIKLNNYQPVDLSPNTTYTLSAWIKTQNVSLSTGAQVFPQNFGGVSGLSNKIRVGGTTDWTYYSVQFTTGADPSGAKINFRLWNASGIAWFDDIRLVESGL